MTDRSDAADADLVRARELLEADGLSVVAVRGTTVIASEARGMAPLVGWIDEGLDLTGFSVADAVVGKAPALLYALLGPRAVWSPVMTNAARKVLAAHGIAPSCGRVTDMIVNRAGDGQCPMDAACAQVDDPAEALAAVRATMERLRAAQG